MDSIKENVEDLVSHVGDYIETQKKLFQLNAAETVASTVSNGASLLIMGVLAAFVVLFLSVGLGFYLAGVLGSNTKGFLAVAGFYALLLVVFFLAKKALVQQPISNSIIAKMLEDYERQ